MGTPEALRAANQYKREWARASKKAQDEMRAEEEEKARAEQERADNWLKSQPWSAGEVLKVAGDCMAAEGNMRAHAQAARGSVELTGAAPSRGLINRYEAAASEGAAKCEKFATEYGDYLNQFGDDGYANLWRHCEAKYNAGLCSSVRYWIQSHR